MHFLHILLLKIFLFGNNYRTHRMLQYSTECPFCPASSKDNILNNHSITSKPAYIYILIPLKVISKWFEKPVRVKQKNEP
jgi:hypothetical protein